MRTEADDDTRTDPRVTRTHRLLQDALLSLARERSLDAISVADIADRATVNRSTFYQHYADKDTLLADALDAEAARAGADFPYLERPIRPEDDPPEVFVQYLRHVSENIELYRRALGEHGSPVAAARLRHRITTLAQAGIEQMAPDRPGTVPAEIVAASLAGSLLGVLIAWLEQQVPAAPTDIARWAWQVLTRGVGPAMTAPCGPTA
ncbi:TetR/AcrR family transcriptional regulator [Cellulomonas hominis]